MNSSDLKPNLFLIGAPKAGTTVVTEVFRQHREFFVPVNKEPRFFDAPIFYDFPEDYPIKLLSDYLRLYQSANRQQHRWLVDASVFNMYRIESIEAILNLTPQARFLVFLRDPLAASKSMHAQRLKYAEPGMREISEDFGCCWRSLAGRKRGENFPERCRNRFLFRYDELYAYEKYIPPILTKVRPEAIRIFLYEDLQRDPRKVCEKLTEFLDLETSLKWVDRVVNPAVVVSRNPISRWALKLARPTAELRRRWGLSGDRVAGLRKILTGQRAYQRKDDSELDREVREAFGSTYLWLDQLTSRISENKQR